MTEPAKPSLESVLRNCAETAPEPWYPSVYSRENGVDRDSLDPPLEQLRMGGWLELTEWKEGIGQGYRITEQGAALLKDSKAVAKLIDGILPPPPRPKPAKEDHLPDQGASAWVRGEAVREAFLNPSPLKVVPALIVINAVLFIIQESADPDSLTGWLVWHTDTIDRLGILQGEWWRLLSSAFYHGGIGHIFMNMMALFFLGQMGERIWGSWRFLTIYLMAGLGGSFLVLLFSKYPALGASGAICGIFGGQAVWLIMNQSFLPEHVVATWKRQMLINGFLILVISIGVPRISLEAHLGGAVIGGITAFLVHYHRFGAAKQRWLALAGMALLPLVGLLVVFRAMEDPKAWPVAKTRQAYIQLTEGLGSTIRIYDDLIKPALAGQDSSIRTKALDEIQEVKTTLKNLPQDVDTNFSAKVRAIRFCTLSEKALQTNPTPATLASELQEMIGKIKSSRNSLQNELIRKNIWVWRE